MTELDLSNEAPNTAERNILLFGASGSGKSSILKMLGSSPEAIISARAARPTLFEAHPYRVQIGGIYFSIVDLTGLSDNQSFSMEGAKRKLKVFLQELSDRGKPLHLLVQCIRGPRINATAEKNYQLIYRNICDQNVPIVTIITGLENHLPTMEDWWTDNPNAFESYRMKFKDHACITATRGKELPGGFRYEEEYNESVKSVHNLLLKTDQEGWRFDMGRFDSLWDKITSYLLKHFFGIGKTVLATSTAVADKTQVIQQMAWRLLLEKLWTLLKNCATSWFTKSTKSMDNVPWAGVSELVIYELSQDSFEAARTALQSHLKDKTSSRHQVVSVNIRRSDTQKPGDLPYLEVVLKPGLFPEPSPDILDAVRGDLSTFCDGATGLKRVSVISA